MMSIDWYGPPPSPRLAAALRDEGMSVRRCRTIAGEGVVVVSTSDAQPSSVTPTGAWIWVAGRQLSDGARRDAVLRGAYEALSVEEPEAAGTLARRVRELLAPHPPTPATDTIVTVSPRSRRLLEQVAQVAATSMPVLLTGETGTGKEVIARLIHTWSSRHDRRFVPINCAAIPNELMEAELFGYARGAFSGAVQGYDGQVMAAEGGTVFLDEIDDTPLETQVKLLRVLEDRVVSRLGENVWHEVDFRILAATNRDLRGLVAAGAFGLDLYERLAIVTISLPALRERVEDLEPIARFFMARFAREQKRSPVTSVRGDALRALQAYAWPGNIRELRNVIYQTLVYKRAGDEILLSDLPRRVLQADDGVGSQSLIDPTRLADRIASGAMNLRDEVAALERAAVAAALRQSGGNAAKAAKLLGSVGRGTARDPGSTMRAMMRRLGASAPPGFKGS
ncbi:MAG: sigma-54 dependent transcriptional regulator [Vicinamibacterales bacterium]